MTPAPTGRCCGPNCHHDTHGGDTWCSPGCARATALRHDICNALRDAGFAAAGDAVTRWSPSDGPERVPLYVLADAVLAAVPDLSCDREDASEGRSPKLCWDPVNRIVITHAGDDVRVVENVSGHDAARTVPLVPEPEMRAEAETLRRELEAASGRDPYGPYPMWRGAVCGRPDCACAAPKLPCPTFEGIAETGPYCPCCSWNEAAHHAAAAVRQRRVQAWRDSRPVVATVCKVTVPGARWFGQWVAISPAPHVSSPFATQGEALDAAHAVARARTAYVQRRGAA